MVQPFGGSRPPPRSCDTFAILPAEGSGLPVCFGKNSDRPSDEEHEVVYVPRQRFAEGSNQRCTYIEVPQVNETLAVVLSKPRWLWGCEMGSNELGVVGGNEAVWTRAAGELGSEERLLGMDILRLTLERAKTAREAVSVCTGLLEKHGQGGGCAEGDDWTYENGFLFADASEAFVVETAGVSWWAAERVPLGAARNISNGISIRSDLFVAHPALADHCKAMGWWDGVTHFDFKAALTGCASAGALEPMGREAAGMEMLAAISRDVARGSVPTGEALARRMMGVLRDEASGICFRDLHGFNSTGSQVSLLPAPGAGSSGGTHYFTCASDPKVAAYKRFDFEQAAKGTEEETGRRSLQLWRVHRERALQRKSPPRGALSGIEERALGEAGPNCQGDVSLSAFIEEELLALAA